MELGGWSRTADPDDALYPFPSDLIA